MKQTDDLDKLISRYSSQLMDLGNRYGHTSTDSKSYENSDEKQLIADENNTGQEDSNNKNQPAQEDTNRQEITETEESNSDDEYEEHKENLSFARRLSKENYEVNEQITQERSAVSPSSENPKENPENFAVFTARIFAAQGALPVEGAKVIVKRNGEIHSYLLTNGSGETKAVKLEAYPEENSREPLNPEKQMIYTADIYAEGFESKENLLVEATGGSHVILQQFMVPVQQGGD